MRARLVLGILVAAFSAEARAQEEDNGAVTAAVDEPAETTSGLTVSGGATLVSDYRFRGISQTDKRFAVQGTVTVAHESGLYGTVWASSIDDYVINGADAEIDLSAGFRRTFSGTTVDVGVLYYHYPGSGGVNSDFFEPYASVAHTLGPVTGKLSAAYAPKQSALSVGSGKEDNLYLAADLSAGVPGTPFSLAAHLGHTYGPSYISIGRGYTDWSVSASYTLSGLTFGLGYVDTDDDFITPSGRNASKAGIVGSVGVSF